VKTIVILQCKNLLKLKSVLNILNKLSRHGHGKTEVELRKKKPNKTLTEAISHHG